MPITDKASILESASALLMLAVVAVWRILWSWKCCNTCNINLNRCSFMFLSSEHIINRLMILFLCMRVYLIYHFIYLLVLFTVKWAYSGFLAIQFLVTLFILARKLTEIQWFFTVRCLSVGKNFKTWLFLVMTLLVTVTDKCRPVLVFFQRWLYMYVLCQAK